MSVWVEIPPGYIHTYIYTYVDTYSERVVILHMIWTKRQQTGWTGWLTRMLADVHHPAWHLLVFWHCSIWCHQRINSIDGRNTCCPTMLSIKVKLDVLSALRFALLERTHSQLSLKCQSSCAMQSCTPCMSPIQTTSQRLQHRHPCHQIALQII